MFGLFKKKKTEIKVWELDMLSNIINRLPSEYKKLEDQIKEKLLTYSLIGYSTYIPEYVAFSFNSAIIKRFEDKKARSYQIRGIKIYDTISETYLSCSIYVTSNLISGYVIACDKKYVLDVNKIDTSRFFKMYTDNDDFKKLSKILDIHEIKFINPDEVYELTINGKLLYHILDLEDGDFIGIDNEKIIYKVTHDPFESIVLSQNLYDIINGEIK